MALVASIFESFDHLHNPTYFVEVLAVPECDWASDWRNTLLTLTALHENADIKYSLYFVSEVPAVQQSIRESSQARHPHLDEAVCLLGA